MVDIDILKSTTASRPAVGVRTGLRVLGARRDSLRPSAGVDRVGTGCPDQPAQLERRNDQVFAGVLRDLVMLRRAQS